MSPPLVCPLCSEGLAEEGSHFYRHFKYRRYACGEAKCSAEFYTEVERNAHCSASGHKRSFQKTVNPYIDRMIAMVSTDARELATKELETVIENRWGVDDDCRIVSTPKSSESTPVVVAAPVKKKRSLVAPTESSSAKIAKKSSQPTSSKETPKRAPPKESPSTSTSNPEVDSTTDDQVRVATPVEKQKKTRKRRIESEKQQQPATATQSYENMSAVDKLIGWFDPNVPERVDAAKVVCAVCHQDIVYDFVIRRSHVADNHMAADVDPQDYCDLLNAAMNRSFPELPNSTLACQLCMTGTDIRKSTRREHIEKLHTTSLPPLECPHGGCGRGYRRQCELSSHMKEVHKSDMSRFKSVDFQLIRRRRNAMINEMINKCFPWSKLETLELPVLSAAEQSGSERNRTNSEMNNAPNVDFSFGTDVRVLDVNKTRRAPQYNDNDSSDSDSDGDNDTGSKTDGQPEQDYSQDVIFIGYQFDTEVARKLSYLNTVTIKQEVASQDEQEQAMMMVPPAVEEEEVKEEPAENAQRSIETEAAILVGEIALPPPQPQPLMSLQYGIQSAEPRNYSVFSDHHPPGILPADRTANSNNYPSRSQHDRYQRDSRYDYNHHRSQRSSYHRNGRDSSPSRRHHQDRHYNRSYSTRSRDSRW